MHRHISFRQAFRKPRFDWNFRKSEKLRAVDDVKAVHVPIALLHMRNDWLIDHKHSEALYENANEPKEMHLLDLPGSFHADRIFAVAGAQAREILLDFWERIEEKKAALARG
jgi:dienelactone hydrolase